MVGKAARMELKGGTGLAWPALVLCWVLVRVLVAPSAAADPVADGAPLAGPLIAYWMDHAELDAPAACAPFTQPLQNKRHEQTLAAIARHGRGYEPRAGDPAHLSRLCAELQGELGRRGWRIWALMPAAGAAQRGLLTYGFLHGAWSTLMVNGLILLLCLGQLERVWSTPGVLAVFIAGVVAAGLVTLSGQGLDDLPTLGAAGGVAACVGAWSARFRDERLSTPAWLPAGLAQREIAAWLACLGWLGLELARIALGADLAGLSLNARLTGFAVGVGVALALEYGDMEQLRALVGGRSGAADKSGATQRRDAPGEAAASIASGAGGRSGRDEHSGQDEHSGAEEASGRVATAEREAGIWDLEATPLAEAEPAPRPPSPPPQATEPSESDAPNSAVADLLAALSDEPEPASGAPLGRAPVARRIGTRTERYGERPAGSMRAALAEARLQIQMAADRPEPEPIEPGEDAARLAMSAEVQLRSAEGPARDRVQSPGPTAEQAAVAAPDLDPGVSFNRAQMLGWTADGLVIACADGRHLNVPPGNIRTIVVGLAQVGRDGEPEVLADLVLDGQRPGQRIVLRFALPDMALAELAPGFSDRQVAWTALLVNLRDSSQARTLPQGDWPGPPLRGFRNEDAFNETFYGR